MYSGRFAAIQDDSDSDSDEQPDDIPKTNAVVPSYEDLSTSRADEETVLSAIYGPDFTREDGAWGCAKLNVQVRPPDVDQSHVGSQLRLSVQLSKQYPYVLPKIELQDVKGLSKEQQSDLMGKLKERGAELAKSGNVMVCELVQVTEDFLLEHNQDPNMSAWEQMKAREAKEQESREQLERQRSKELKLLMQAEGSSTKIYSYDLPPSPSPSGNRIGFDSEQPIIQVGADSSGVERELARQKEAFLAAEVRRGYIGNDLDKRAGLVDTIGLGNDGHFLKGVYEIDDDDYYDDDIEDDDNAPAAQTGFSRYQSDFIELGVLGRGGGGEVVKVRNRLDRRICT